MKEEILMAGIDELRTIDQNKLKEIISKNTSKSAILEEIGVSAKNSHALRFLTKFIEANDIDVSHFKFGYSVLKKHNKEKLSSMVKSCNSLSELLRELGLADRGGNFKSIRKLIDHYGIDISHFEVNTIKYISNKKPDEEIFCENSNVAKSTLRRRYKGIVENKCSECGITSWNGKEITLQVDHINGIRNDNRLSNLRLLCPNCHSQTDTFCIKNFKN